MANLNNGPVCINHHDRPAVAHCASCRRPICEECLVEQDGFKCCSKKCLQQALASTAITNDILSRRSKAGSAGKVAGFIKWVVIIGVIVFLWLSGYGRKGFDWVRNLTRKGNQTIQQKASEGVQKMNNRYEHQKNVIDQVADPAN